MKEKEYLTFDQKLSCVSKNSRYLCLISRYIEYCRYRMKYLFILTPVRLGKLNWKINKKIQDRFYNDRVVIELLKQENRQTNDLFNRVDWLIQQNKDKQKQVELLSKLLVNMETFINSLEKSENDCGKWIEYIERNDMIIKGEI